MECLHSRPLPPSEAPTGNLAGDIPVRRSHSSHLEHLGAKRAQSDWERLVGPLPQDFHGTLAAKYSLVEVTLPECSPERLEVISYAVELGFLYDDWTEFHGQEDLSRANNEMSSGFSTGKAAVTGIQGMQGRLFRDMSAIDPTRAQNAATAWSAFLNEAAGKQHQTKFSSFDSYMAYRVLDVGEMFWFGLLTYAMKLDIPQTETSSVREMTRPCWVVLALQNDICSYGKEMAAAHANGTNNVVNALVVLMETEDITLQQAEQQCRERISHCLAEYQATLEETASCQTLSHDTKVYMEALLYTISGDAAWSLVTPRYNF